MSNKFEAKLEFRDSWSPKGREAWGSRLSEAQDNGDLAETEEGTPVQCNRAHDGPDMRASRATKASRHALFHVSIGRQRLPRDGLG